MTDSQTYYHGTKADLKVGDLIAPAAKMLRTQTVQR